MYPYNGSFVPVQPLQRMNQYQPYQGYGNQMLIKGRMVAGLDEAKAAQFDLDGTLSFFPSLSENAIYVKSIDLNGLPIFQVYKLVDNRQEQRVVYANNDTVMALQKRVEQLENALKGVSGNVQQSNANVANDGSTATKQQSSNANAEHVWE